MTPSIGLVVVRGGVAEVYAPIHTDIRIVDLDNLENENDKEELPKNMGFEKLVEDAGIMEYIKFKSENQKKIEPNSQPILRSFFDMEKTGTLPDEFDQWDLADKDGWTVAHIAAKLNKLPPDFDRWDLIDDEGWPVAHEAASYNHLPKDFNQWELRSGDGRTVAHVAAHYGHLPVSFNQWELVDGGGWSVAHEAAKYDRLPDDFNEWELSDISGRTVADVYRKHNPQAEITFNQAEVKQQCLDNINKYVQEELKQRCLDNILKVVEHHKQYCIGSDCDISLHLVGKLVELAGIELTTEQKNKFT